MSLLETMKRAALAAFEASNPVNMIYGTVIKSKPIEIEIHKDLILTEEFLDIAEHLTRHERIVTIEHNEMAVRDLGDKKEIDNLDTDDKAYPATTYKHSYVKMIFEDGLKIDEKVVLIRMQGGHKFLVIDRYREGKKKWSYPQKQ